MNDNEKDTARIYTRAMLRAALIAELDDFPEYSPLDDSKVVDYDDIDYLVDSIYDNHGIPTDISMLTEGEEA